MGWFRIVVLDDDICKIGLFRRMDWLKMVQNNVHDRREDGSEEWSS